MSTNKILRKKWSDSEQIDLIVVIGLDSPESLKKMARDVGGEVYLDEQGSVMKGLKGKGVPHWWVLSSDNKILKHLSGYYNSVDEMIKRLEL